jgi:hypothetical protein
MYFIDIYEFEIGPLHDHYPERKTFHSCNMNATNHWHVSHGRDAEASCQKFHLLLILQSTSNCLAKCLLTLKILVTPLQWMYIRTWIESASREGKTVAIRSHLLSKVLSMVLHEVGTDRAMSTYYPGILSQVLGTY